MIKMHENEFEIDEPLVRKLIEELVALNENWASIRVSQACNHRVVGVVLSFFSEYYRMV
ncbi:hypothetical protein [Legionella nagasakiensis]|uniref:hypothetical protein n=1 Tax=Legionella nagasakiensis TaxID=535290 RepID=UPI0013EFACD6|nr:hypothetical protein [Legionella nagasakiensis]